MNYYKILGVSENANLEEIKEAFRQKAMQCHPDRFSDPKEKIQKTQEFQTLNEAYMALSRYFENKREREEAEKEAARARAERERQDREEQERRERERREKEERERRAREKEAQNQGPFSGFDYNGFWFEAIRFRYRYEAASIEEIKRHNAFTPPEELERVNRILKPFAAGGSFFDPAQRISEVSMTFRFTGHDLSGEFLFTKNGAYNYSWKGTFQMRGYKGSAARFMIRDFKDLVTSSYNTAMDWANEIAQNGHPAPAEPEDDEWDEDEPESYQKEYPEEDDWDEEEPESYQEEYPVEDSYDDEGDLENEKLDPVVEAAAGIWNIGYYTVPALLISLGSFCLGDPVFGGIFLLIAILVGGVLFLLFKSTGAFDYFKKTKPKPAPAKPKPAPAKPQTGQKASATAAAPDAPIEWGWALVGGLALMLVCILIGGMGGALLFAFTVVMVAVLGLVAWITK